MPNVFVDTNILLYAHDVSEGPKHAAAQASVRQLLAQDALPSISAQVLHELYVNLVRGKVSRTVAREIISAYAGWNVIANDATLVLEAISLIERYKISLWDSLIIAAALRAGANELWSEDLSDGQDYGGVRVINPLK